jgi:adenosylcobinamide amidohydrolase
LPPHILTVPSARLLVVPLGAPHDVLSWAIVGGGRRVASDVVWREVVRGELGPEVDPVALPAALLRRALAEAKLPDAVGLLTARDVRSFDTAEAVDAGDAGLSARCVATVGLANALAAGDPPGPFAPGTINLVVAVSVPLTEEALLEALALAAEARTAAMLEVRLPSPLSGRPASGTGTDCIVVAAPVARPSVARFAYAGKHTRVGSLLGAAVRDAVARGIARWLEEARCAKQP